MKPLKRIGFFLALVFMAALDIFVYWNSRFYERAKTQEDEAKKIAYLEKSNKFCPLNDLVFYELGKAHLDLGLKNISDPATAETHYRKAAEGLERSITVNPASPYAHFYLGRALRQLSLLRPSDDSRSLDEFRKAALLAGEDSQIYGEVGRLFFARWKELSEADRSLTLRLLQRVLAKKDKDQILAVLSIWEMNVGDYGVMDSIMPSDPQLYRIYAQYLGEKSLSLSERHKFLADAELLEFEEARSEFQAGEYALFRNQIAEARRRLDRALGLLEGIRFYQAFLAQSTIAGTDYSELLRSIRLDLAKCRIEEGGKFEDVEADLRNYLAVEDRPKEIGALETYLKGRGILMDQAGASFEDLGRLACELLLQFKQTRYRDIISLGRTLQQSVVVVPDAKQKDYARVLRIIGDSYQRADFLYDAGDTYRQTLGIEPQSLETLLRLRANYDRLNDERKLREIEEAIGGILTPGTLDLAGQVVLKGQPFSRSLVFDGGKVALDLRIEFDQEGPTPMVAVFFNGRVVWEDRLTGDVISLNLETNPGENILQVIPLNRAVSLTEITWRPEARISRE